MEYVDLLRMARERDPRLPKSIVLGPHTLSWSGLGWRPCPPDPKAVIVVDTRISQQTEPAAEEAV